MRRRIGLGILALVVAMAAGADANRDRGKAAGQSVTNKWGTPQSFQDKAITPMASGEKMSTIDNSQQFGAQVSCPGAKRFMQLTLIPSNTGDMDRMAVDLDANFDGTPDQHTTLTGPFAAMCDNGMVQCVPGSMNSCKYLRWKADSSGVALNPYSDSSGMPNTIKDMGACYCFNNSCGNGLLLLNAKKILEDAGAGIALAMQATTPRFALSGSNMIDTTSAEFFGQTSGCGADQRPEQYYKDTGALQAKGASNASDPDSTYNKILSSQTAAGHQSTTSSCQVNRSISMRSFWNDSVITASFSGDGEIRSCGTGCMELVLGRVGNNYLSGGCGLYTTSADVVVHRPELITSAVLTQVAFDDWLRFRLNGNILWNADANWTSEPARCGENGNRGSRAPNLDLAGYFRDTVPGSGFQLRQDTSWNDKGEGWAIIRIQYGEDCDVESETVDNGCTAQENNTECSLRDEDVDGVTTIRGFSRTGLSPMPQTRDYAYGSCKRSITRAFFQKKRTYTCPAEPSPYSGEAAQKRYESIHGSFNPTTGAYTDTKYKDGSYSSSSEKVNALPPPDARASCPMVCKTRKPRPGVAVGELGPQNKLNPNGVAHDYTYRSCTETNACPLESGETVVSGCACRDNFGEAAAAMQTIRQVSQDSVCQAQ